MLHLHEVAGRFARSLIRGVVRFYYARIEITGRDLVPDSGPVLFVANHANSLFDPVIIGIAAGKPVHFLAKAPLFDIPVFGAVLRALGMVPAYRGADDPSQVASNLKSLGEAAAFLVRGEAVGIFPEGKSHDALKVDKVRSGAARIAIQAFREGAGQLKIVPLGINYERKERFRSSVWVRVGTPIELSDWPDRICEDERAAMRALTSEIDARLKQAVIHLQEEKWEPFVSDLEALVPAANELRRAPAGALRQRKRIADAINYFLNADRPRAEAAASAIQSHRENLEAAGLSVRSDLLQVRGARLLARQARDLIWLLAGFVPAFLGTVHGIVPFMLVRLINSFVRRVNRSTVSLARLGLGLPIYGAWYAGLWWLLGSYFVPWLASGWVVAMVMSGIFAFSYWPQARDAARLWWDEARMLLQKEKLENLRAEHAHLQSLLGTFAEEFRRIQPVDEPMPAPSGSRRKRAAVAAGSVLGLLLLIVFCTSWNSRNESFLAERGFDLRQLNPQQLATTVAEDEQALAEILHGLADLESKARQLQAELVQGARDFYSQQDNDAIRQLLFAYLSHRNELLRLIWKYQESERIPDEALRCRAFLTALTAASALYESSLKLVTQFADTPAAIKKLNEGEPLWDIPPGLYDRTRMNLVAVNERRLMESGFDRYADSQLAFDKAGLAHQPYDLFHATVERARTAATAGQPVFEKWKRSMPLEHAGKLGRSAVYRAQSFLSTWVGDTRVRRPRQGKPLIQPRQIEELRAVLQPGDILLERQNWFLSRAFMPGYWAHAAIYVGTTNDFIRMGLDKDPRVQKFWKEFAAPDAAGHEHVILEAVPRGVRMISLEHCIGIADSAAVLRPQISPDKLPETIAHAFSHLGKPYDFEFDFFSTDKLVCTELVYRSCGIFVDFPLVEVLGRKTLPPTEIARKFVRELSDGTPQLEFIAFLDGQESKGKAHFADAQAFAETVHRPSLTWLQGN